jgi:hypothetical protein
MVPLSGFSVVTLTLSSVYLSGVTCDIITCSYGQESGVSAIRSTMSSVYLSGVTFYISTCSYGHCVRCVCHQFYSVEYLTGVTCDIITCSYGYCVRCICREVYSVECASVWRDLLYNYVFIWTMCLMYLPSILPRRMCISLV